MSRMRRFMCLFLVIIMSLLSITVPVSAASLRNKKIVSVVYDDSNSMHISGQLKWAYANYAMQAFAGMLNKEDVLMINYMSSVAKGNNAPVTINTTDRGGSVNHIRSHSDADGTPFNSIDVAYQNLQSKNDNNPNTQYWLVVMTDGEFNETTLADVENKLNSIADGTMPNGSKPHIVFLSMCDSNGTFTPKSNLKSNINVKSVEEAQAIADAIADISDEISGRYSVAKNDIKIVDEKTIQVSSKLPLINIGVLTQFSQAKVEKVTVEKNSTVAVESNVGIQYPDVPGRTTDPSLIGNVALIGTGKDNIPAGTYTITFSEAVSAENINVMFEPALELRMVLFSEGNKVDDPTKLAAGSVITAKADLYEAGTDNEIDLSQLPGDVTHFIQHMENGNEIKSTDTLELADIQLTVNPTKITATLKLEGYFTLTQTVDFTPKDIIVSGITSELYYDGSERFDPDDGEDVVYISELKHNKTGVKFYLTVGQTSVDKETAEGMLSKVKAGIESDIGNYTVEVMDDGAFLVHPSKKSIWYPSFVYWLIHHGDCAITLNLDGQTTGETLQIKLGNPGCIIDVWPWIALLILLWFIFLKKRFYHTETIDFYRGTLRDGEMDFGRRAVGSETLGFLAGSCTIGSHKFVAESNLLNRNNLVSVKLNTSDKFRGHSKKKPATRINGSEKRILFSGTLTLGNENSCEYYKRQ